MRIEIWKQQAFKGYRHTSSRLIAFTYFGRAYASWTLSNRPSRFIPMSDELAYQVLGATRQLCPNVGLTPVLSTWGMKDYLYRDVSISGKPGTEEICTVCGYQAKHLMNPLLGGHPETTYLRPEKESAYFTQATWDYDHHRLTVPSQDETDDEVLVIWAKGQWHIRTGHPERKLFEQYPGIFQPYWRSGYVLGHRKKGQKNSRFPAVES